MVLAFGFVDFPLPSCFDIQLKFFCHDWLDDPFFDIVFCSLSSSLRSSLEPSRIAELQSTRSSSSSLSSGYKTVSAETSTVILAEAHKIFSRLSLFDGFV